MPRWLSQTWGFPFLLNRWIIVASLNAWGMASFLHIIWNNSVSFSAIWRTSCFVDLCSIASDPGALPDDRSFIAFTVSETVGSSSSSGLHSTCGSLLIASSLIDDGRLRTPSKCSAHQSVSLQLEDLLLCRSLHILGLGERNRRQANAAQQTYLRVYSNRLVSIIYFCTSSNITKLASSDCEASPNNKRFKVTL